MRVIGEFNQHQSRCRLMDDLVVAAARRYGPRGQAVGYVLYEQLIAMRFLLAEDPHALVVAARIAALRDALTAFHELSTPDGPPPPTTVVQDDPLVLEFDRAAFRAYGYDVAAPAVMAATTRLSPETSTCFVPRAAYLYAITDDGEIRVWLRSFGLADLTFGRDRARIGSTPIAHPMLVPETLRISAAGEVIFIGPGGGAHPKAAIVNTKSGHFRPPPQTGNWARSRFAEELALDERDIDLIVIS